MSPERFIIEVPPDIDAGAVRAAAIRGIREHAGLNEPALRSIGVATIETAREVVQPGAYDDGDGTPEQRTRVAQLAEEYESVEVLGYAGPSGAPGLLVRLHRPGGYGHRTRDAIVTFGGQLADTRGSAATETQGQGGP